LWSPRNQSRRRTRRALLLAALLAAVAAPASAQADGTTAAGGQSEIALQGYYLGGNGQPLLNTSGVAYHFQEFLPQVGFLNANLEGYGSQNRFQTGENFLELRGAPWMGHHWTITGGDFRTPASLVEFPFTNIYLPEIDGRGIRVAASHEDTQYSFFAGEETLTAGPRVAYRILIPQTIIGASVRRRIARHLELGGRFLQLSASPESMAANPDLFPANRAFSMVRTLTMQALYSPLKQLKIYGEASQPFSQDAVTVTSSVAGLAWESPQLSLHANYVRQGVLYLPLAGYFLGDREGPFAEVRYRPWKRLELLASASQYHNNLEHNDAAPSFRSTSNVAGITSLLPGGVSASAQISTVNFSSQGGGQPETTSDNRQIDATLSRTIRRHTVHLEWRDIRLDTADAPQRQRSSEAGDTYQFKHLSLGGSVRYQQISGAVRYNSVFGRVVAVATAGRFSAFANVEIGQDLQNQTVFSTEAYRTSEVGMAVRLTRGWNLQTEVFRNSLNLNLNPENIFLLDNTAAYGGASPVAESIAAMSQWSLYFRLTKQLRWGAGLPVENLGHPLAAMVPLVGAIEGVVWTRSSAGRSLAGGIPVSLDGGRTSVTGADGRYRFENVAEGPHEVGLALAELPADYDPAEPLKSRVVVLPRRLERTDFEVLPLLSVTGRITGPEGAALDGIVVRLLPGNRYTTTNNSGAFAFYNLHEGDFELVADPKSLPENGQLSAPERVPLVLRVGAAVPPVDFRFTVSSKDKPIVKVLDHK